MEYYIGDIVKMRKSHPCGNDLWEITRVGLDFRIRCQKCAHSVMLPRQQFARQVKAVISRGDPELTAAVRPHFDLPKPKS
ncbi:MAG: DUF951 domain-containing protein [Symbiobacteriaceae bacterium]|nr:DUF951 domain-containing protein [Symbiobacteriaceae bacterium]